MPFASLESLIVLVATAAFSPFARRHTSNQTTFIMSGSGE